MRICKRTIWCRGQRQKIPTRKLRSEECVNVRLKEGKKGEIEYFREENYNVLKSWILRGVGVFEE
jgi:hypothetical protein